MAKWADYLISAVRFNAAETHIDKVRTHTDNDDKIGPAVDIDRSTVVGRIESGYTFETIYKGSNGNWQRGKQVKIVVINGVKYIKTYADNTTRDNLDDLPRF